MQAVKLRDALDVTADKQPFMSYRELLDFIMKRSSNNSQQEQQPVVGMFWFCLCFGGDSEALNAEYSACGTSRPERQYHCCKRTSSSQECKQLIAVAQLHQEPLRVRCLHQHH